MRIAKAFSRILYILLHFIGYNGIQLFEKVYQIHLSVMCTHWTKMIGIDTKRPFPSPHNTTSSSRFTRTKIKTSSVMVEIKMTSFFKTYFSLSDDGELFILPGARYGENNLQITVADAETSVTSTATVRIFYLDEDALDNVASLRLSG